MPIFRDTCKEFGVPWQEYSWADIFGSLWKNWLKGLYQHTPMITTPPRGHCPVADSSLRIKPLSDLTFGAEVTGVRVESMSPAEASAVQRAWAEFGVLVIRDQKLTPDDEVAFARLFPHSRTCDLMRFCGPLAQEGFDAEEWRKFKLPGRPEIQLRGRGELKDHYGVTGFLDTGKGAKEYHSDSCHEFDTPPIFTSLFCLATPGRDETLFLDARLAYDLMSLNEKLEAEELFVQYKRVPSPLHESGLAADLSGGLESLGKLYGACVENSQGGDIAVSEVHPLVWTHPITGRKSVIAAPMWMYRLVHRNGEHWSPEKSHAYIHRILAKAEARRYQHQWKEGDLVCFDNRSLLHSASAAPKDLGFRLLHQIILCGDQIPMGPAGVGVGNPLVNPNVTAVR
jgi:taurine dioxygenase